jgi:AcrR family transcriptional regulator
VSIDEISRIDQGVRDARERLLTAAFYHHVPSKDDLVLAFLERREPLWTHDWLEADVKRRSAGLEI